MNRIERLRAVPLFAGLPDEDLTMLDERVTEVDLPKGEVLFEEGADGDAAYVIVGGEMEIIKKTANREVLLAVQGPGAVIGEMALLQEAPRMATGKARTDMTLLQISKATLDHVLDSSTSAARTMFDVILSRWRENQAQLRQSERMAQLGTLSAGLAHELNNPAAAVKRGAESLAPAVEAHGAAFATAMSVLDTDALRTRLQDLLADVMTRAARPPDLDALTRSDRETEVEDWLVAKDVDRAWEIAPAVVELGFDVDTLVEIVDSFPSGAAPAVVVAIHATQTVGSLLHEVQEGAGRLSAIVKALKSYTYLDQAPVQTVDLRVGLDDTLLILKSKLQGITVHREYDPGLPLIEAYGSELNQVWTNLIDNASYAIHNAEKADGQIVIRAFPIDDGVAVEVEDNGPGIPDDVQAKVFDSFFTTKPPGSGTGLGLDISRAIVMNRHAGEISVTSRPGRTTFRVDLPLRPPS